MYFVAVSIVGLELVGRHLSLSTGAGILDRDNGESSRAGTVPPPHNAENLGGLNTLLIQIFSRSKILSMLSLTESNQTVSFIMESIQ